MVWFRRGALEPSRFEVQGDLEDRPGLRGDPPPRRRSPLVPRPDSNGLTGQRHTFLCLGGAVSCSLSGLHEWEAAFTHTTPNHSYDPQLHSTISKTTSPASLCARPYCQSNEFAPTTVFHPTKHHRAHPLRDVIRTSTPTRGYVRTTDSDTQDWAKDIVDYTMSTEMDVAADAILQAARKIGFFGRVERTRRGW